MAVMCLVLRVALNLLYSLMLSPFSFMQPDLSLFCALAHVYLMSMSLDSYNNVFFVWMNINLRLRRRLLLT
jgi:hypothetical protein